MRNQQIDLDVVKEFFAEECSANTFLQGIHKAMTDYILCAGRYEGHGDIDTVSENINFLGAVYDMVLKASNKEKSTGKS